MSNECTIHELVLQVVKALEELGLTPQTVWSYYGYAYLPIVKFHKQHDTDFFDRAIVDEYEQIVDRRHEKGEIGRYYYRDLKKAAERLVEFYDTGKLIWTCRKLGSKFKLNGHYEEILQDFLCSEEFHPNTHGDVTWVTRKYLAYLQQTGCPTIDSVHTKDISQFISHCSQHMKPNSLRNITCYLKKLHGYWEETGRLIIPYKDILSFPAVRSAKIRPPLSQEELNRILAQIDISTDIGKRDYAIILLGAASGLRAVDIVHLKLRDIDWRNEKIFVLQQKTGESLSLPLIPSVGESIKEYVLCSRPASESEYIFLRHKAPFQKLSDGVPIGNMFDSYQQKAGIERTPHDGKGFHSLRRLLGRNMTIAGIPVTTIAQVLGQSNTNSVKQYISLDSKHLKDCALDFHGIEVVKGVC